MLNSYKVRKRKIHEDTKPLTFDSEYFQHQWICGIIKAKPNKSQKTFDVLLQSQKRLLLVRQMKPEYTTERLEFKHVHNGKSALEWSILSPWIGGGSHISVCFNLSTGGIRLMQGNIISLWLLWKPVVHGCNSRHWVQTGILSFSIWDAWITL